MPAGLKELIVVLAFAAVIFRLAKPVVLRFSSESDFSRRRAVWLILTASGFLSPSFWVFALVAVPVLLWAQRRDTNPVAFYLALLQVVPFVSIEVPFVGMNELFRIDIFRLLSLCVLVPAAWRYWRLKRAATVTSRFGAMDVLLIGYGALVTVLYVPPDLPNHVILPDSPTNLLRRGVLFFVDVYVVYFVASRTCRSRAAIVEALAAFCLSCALLAPVAIFETLRHWLLYVGITVRWTGDPGMAYYTMRGATLRAMASTAGPLVLGYVLAIALGFWLYLGSRLQSARTRALVAALYVLGLFAAFSRGPWMGALTIYLVYIALGPRALPRLFKALVIMAASAGALLASPLGERITSIIPFLGGSVDSYNVRYRERLAERSWDLIQQSPLFGDQLAYQRMEDLRQGMGIIDLVNTYATVAMFYGLVGLSLFASFILLALLRAYRAARRVVHNDPDLALLGINLTACIVGTMVMIAVCSFIAQYAIMFYLLGGLVTAYAFLDEVAEPRVVTQAAQPTGRLGVPRQPEPGSANKTTGNVR